MFYYGDKLGSEENPRDGGEEVTEGKRAKQC